MRITRVVFSFFAVGFVAGTFEQAAGLGDAQRGQSAPAVAAPGPLATALEATPVAGVPSIGELLAPSAFVLDGAPPPAGRPLPDPSREMGDGRAAEAVAVAFARLSPVDKVAMSEGAAPPSPRLRPFFAPTDEPILAVPEPQPAQRPNEFIMPLDHGRVTSMFNQGRYHPAIDLAAPLGTPVHATTRKQKVTFAGRRGGYGNLIVTRDPSGREHYYGHLQRIIAGIGTLLEQGDLLGLLGSTGHSTGPHVHYEVRARSGGHFNPAALLFPGRSVRAGYAWNDARSATVAAAGPLSPALVATRTAPVRTAGARRHMTRNVTRPATHHVARRARLASRPVTVRYHTVRTTRLGTRYAARYGQPRPR